MTRIDDRRRLAVVGASLLVPGLLAFDWALFRFVLGMDYVAWYLANGALIAFGTAFVSGIWDSVEELARPLVSAHPLRYYGACLQLTGIALLALGTSVKSPRRDLRSGQTRVDAVAEWLDTVPNLLVHLAVVGLVLAWVLFVAPANYLVTLVSGAPARESLRYPEKRLVGVVGRSLPARDELQSIYLSPGQEMHVYEVGTNDFPPLADEASRDGVRDLSFASNPFGITQAITSLVLFALGLVV